MKAKRQKKPNKKQRKDLTTKIQERKKETNKELKK
jgi:hypothetical protein